MQSRIIKLLPAKDQARLLADSLRVSFPLMRKLYWTNDKIDAIYFPLDCVVSLLVGAGEEAKVEMAIIGNEGVVGVFSILSDHPALADNLVQQGGEALRLPIGKFQEYVRENGAFHDLMHRYLYVLTSQIIQAGACNQLHTIEERCARWLLMMHDRCGADSFPLTQEFLANTLGVRRATVNISLGLLKGAGLIDSVRGRIAVRDREGLESASCPCYGLIRQRYRDLLSPEQTDACAARSICSSAQ